VPPVQTPSTQSLPTLHFLLSAHAGHVPPPQSMSVSFPSLNPSVQAAGTHLPLPSQRVPPWSLQADAFMANICPHTFPVQVFVAQTVPVTPQSDGATHATHFPLPSHTLPPLSLHAVEMAAGVVPHVWFLQVASTHFVVGAMQSAAARQPTQFPLPSHRDPPLSVHIMPDMVLVVPQHPSVHVAIAHVVVDAGQSAGIEHAVPASHVGPPPVPIPPVPPVPEAEDEEVDAPPPIPPDPIMAELLVAALPPAFAVPVFLPEEPQPDAATTIASAVSAKPNRMFLERMFPVLVMKWPPVRRNAAVHRRSCRLGEARAAFTLRGGSG
jgi:hypothetical protein